MSRMLQALKQIEAKRPRPRPPVNKSPVENCQAACTITQTPAPVEDETPGAPEDSHDIGLMELHPVIQEELEELNHLQSSAVFVEEPISNFKIAPFEASDSSAIEKTLTQAELSVASALCTEQPDVYEGIAQYILTQLRPGQPAALLFTSLGQCTEKTEMLIALSSILADHFHRKAFVLDALSDKVELQNDKLPYNPGDWANYLAQLKSQHQLVFIDAPSLTNFRTAPMISQCDGVYLTIQLGYTKPRELREAVGVIKQAGGRLLGGIAVG